MKGQREPIWECEPCERPFESKGALAIHNSRAQGIKANRPSYGRSPKVFGVPGVLVLLQAEKDKLRAKVNDLDGERHRLLDELEKLEKACLALEGLE